jgi:uncharacterized 2Fe-2S/4Fe-4S cluster protein (DUF4445 family)
VEWNVSVIVDVAVDFEPEGKIAQLPVGSTVAEAAKQAKVGIRSECGGQGSCGKCKVIVRNPSAVGEITQAERSHLSQVELESGYRLACQTKVLRDVTIEIPPASRVESRKIQVLGLERKTELNPSLKKFCLMLPEPTLSDATPDLERLLEGLSRESKTRRPLEIDYEILKELPTILRKANWNVAVVLWDDSRIIDVEPADKSPDLFGLAVDIGTSKIVGHLVNLTSGETVAIGSIENPQIVHGEDIITRIAFASADDANLQTLQGLLVDGVNKVLREACAKAKVDPLRIYHVVGVGNTAMHHFFLGIKPKNVAVSPFTPAVKRQVDVSARTLRIETAPTGIITFLPNIAGLVGADAIADLLATGLCLSDERSLLIDMGTNTEVFAGNKDDVLCCSCASGPAFEGAHVTHGMRAVTGAIERVRISSSFDVEYKTIGGERPRGMCGSAMIDVVAEMLKRKIVNIRGKFDPAIETTRLCKGKGRGDTEFVVAWRDETATDKNITITQSDVGEIQLAKAAIEAGWTILLKHREIRPQKLDRVFIAGAFGEYLNIENAKIIRLVPDVPANKVRFVGNAAVAGAKMALLSKDIRKQAEDAANSVRYLELATDPDFNQEFTRALQFGTSSI